MNHKEKTLMKKIAVPSSNGLLGVHFGHCEHFYIYETEGEKVKKKEVITPPPHQPDLYPAWLNEKKVTHVIAGGMGQKAIDNFKSKSINIHTGAPQKSPDEIIQSFLNGTLETTANLCDH